MRLSTVRSFFEQAFSELGGFDAFMQWARDNPTRFYAMWAKLMPHEDRTGAGSHNPTDPRKWSNAALDAALMDAFNAPADPNIAARKDSPPTRGH